MQQIIKELLEQKESLIQKLTLKCSGRAGTGHLMFCFDSEGLKVYHGEETINSLYLLSFHEINRLKQFLTQFDEPKKQIITEDVIVLPTRTKWDMDTPGTSSVKLTTWQNRKALELKIRTIWADIIQSGDNSILNGRSMKEFCETYSNILSKNKTLSLSKLKQKELKPILKAIKKVKLS